MIARPLKFAELARGAVVAVVVRLVMFGLIAYRTDAGDPTWYDLVADNVLAHGAFSEEVAAPFTPTLFRPPLYVGLIATVRAVAGRSLVPLQVVQSLLGVAAILLLASAVSTISKRHGRWALWLLALSPFDAVYCGAMLSETLATFFVVGGISAPFLLRSRWRWVVSGLMLGLAALTRDVFMLLIPCVAVFAGLFLHRGAAARKRFVATLAVVGAGALAIAPWTIRNYTAVGSVVPISRSSFAHSLYLGTWVRDFSHYEPGHEVAEPELFPEFAFKLPGERELYTEWSWHKNRDPAARDRVYAQLFKQRVAADPFGVAVTWVRRAPIVWVGTTRFDVFAFRPTALAQGRPLNVVLKGFFFALNVSLVAFGMIGCAIAMWKRRWRYVWFALPVLYTIGVLTPLGVVEPRYTQPVYPFVLVMGALAARFMVVAWRRRVRLRIGLLRKRASDHG